MARRSEYDTGKAAGPLKVPVAATPWAHHAGLVLAPDASPGRWSRRAVEAMDVAAILSGSETHRC
ncbi:hypothetical protein [Streptomyces sp. NPDC049040]|uniref:hypothetical protein n=1 Tax=Streptomyces sp. NPDC049040 TaxID=3365593 RepID=UPI00371F9C84